MTRLTWERCDKINCKRKPVAFIKFPAVTAILKENYIIWVRVCEKDLQAESKSSKMELVKIRKGFSKRVRSLLQTKEASGQS